MCQIARFSRHSKRVFFHVSWCSISIKNKWKANLLLGASQHWCCQCWDQVCIAGVEGTRQQHSSKAQNSLPKFTWNWAQLWPHTVHRVVRLGNCHCFCSKPYEYVEHVWEGQAYILRIHWTRLIPRKLPKRPFLEASGGRFIDALNLLGTASDLHMSSYTLQRTFCESLRKIGQQLRSGQPLAGHELFVGKKNRFVQLSRIATCAALVFTRPRLHCESALA